MYQRLDALYVEIRKELMSPSKPSEHKETTDRRHKLFARVVADGFDKFTNYFPQLRPVDINIDIDGGNFLHESFLRIAAVNGQSEFVRLILQWGGHVDARAPGYFDGDGYGMWFPNLGNTALILAASHGHIDCVRLMTENPDQENRAQINFVSHDFGITALHAAARGGHVTCVKYLLEQEARTDIRNKHHEERPLDVAKNDECREAIQLKMLERNESIKPKSSCAIL